MAIAFELPRFYPILDTQVLEPLNITPLAVAEELLQAGVRILQYRHKSDWTQQHFDAAKQIADLCHKLGVLFVLNDRADFARLMGAALHVGQDDLPPVAARRVMDDEVMGFSTHNQKQLERGDAEPVEYLSLGPILQTGTKLKPDPVVGIEKLRAIRAKTSKPVVAIGGITRAHAREVLDAGADSVAVISGLVPEDASRGAFRRTAEEWLRITSRVTGNSGRRPSAK